MSRPFTLFRRAWFQKSHSQTTPEFELIGYRHALPDHNYFHYVQKITNSDNDPEHTESKAPFEALNEQQYQQYWQNQLHCHQLRNEPHTAHCEGRTNCHIVSSYWADYYSHLFNRKLLPLLKFCNTHIDCDEHDANVVIKACNDFISRWQQADTECPLPHAHWPSVLLFQALLLCQCARYTEVDHCLERLILNHEDLEAYDAEIAQQLLNYASLAEDSHEQLNDAKHYIKAALANFELELIAFAKNSRQATRQLGTFNYVQEQLVKVCDTISYGQNPALLLSKHQQLLVQLEQLKQQVGYIAHLLQALLSYEQGRYYINFNRGIYGHSITHRLSSCDPVPIKEKARQHLLHAIASLHYAKSCERHSNDASHNALQTAANAFDREDCVDYKLIQLKQNCLFKIHGSIDEQIDHLTGYYKRYFKQRKHRAELTITCQQAACGQLPPTPTEEVIARPLSPPQFGA